MTNRYLLAIDQGTTGSTVLVMEADLGARVIGRATVEFPQHYPQPGWVEHDLEEIWKSVGEATTKALAAASHVQPSFKPTQVAAIGITNQRETLCVFERKSGRPLCKALVWQDKRSTQIVQRLKEGGFEGAVKAKTGLVLDPYFSGTKVAWLMENQPQVASALRQGEAVLGTIDTYLIARLTGGASFVTEPSNASRTLLYDIGRGAWDKDLLQLMKVPSIDVLPEVRDSAGAFGTTCAGLGFLPQGLPICGALGDQQAALAGQACFAPGEAKCTYGTGAFLLANLGDKPLPSKCGMLTTVAWSLNGKRSYAFEGSAFIAGAAVQFIRDQLGLISKADETEAAAQNVIGAPEVYFVPALAGLGAPYWEPRAHGAFFGLTRGTSRGQMIRAVLEGIAFQVADLTAAMARDLGAPLTTLRVDGGAAANNLLLQAQANFAALPVDRPLNLETTAFGAALFAGLGAGVYSDLAQLRDVRRAERLFQPTETDGNGEDLKARQRAGWARAVKAVQVFAGVL